MIPAIREHAPMTAIGVLTMENGPALARAAPPVGAVEVVLKAVAVDEPLEAIRVAAGGRRISTLGWAPQGEGAEADRALP
jgi:two-component system response regulator NreC